MRPVHNPQTDSIEVTHQQPESKWNLDCKVFNPSESIFKE